MNVEALFEQFKQKRILVVGDVMVDAYLHGSVTRVSPEAPVPIINLKKTEDRLGGAANVALNLRALGANSIVCSIIGEDVGADKMRALMRDMELDTRGLVSNSSRMTTVKTRVIGNHQQLIRIDQEETHPIEKEDALSFLKQVEELMNEGVDAVIFEDYNKGLLTEFVISEVIRMARERAILITVDPKKDNFLAYKNVDLFKPNLKELKEGLKVDFDYPSAKGLFEAAIAVLESELGNRITFVTLSEYGVFVKEGVESTYIPAHVRTIADVSGAGDTVISVATLCLASGVNAVDASRIANLAGGLVCELSGVVPIDKQRLMDEVQKVVIA
ncbi:MAG: carbohydrate kinase, partial [Bacteroidetes bacterium RIFCSPHIGHO2_02_FULL_44_7]